MYLFPGERTKPATPLLPENTEKEDVEEIFKENKGMYRTLPGKIDHGTPLITNTHNYISYLFPSHIYLTVELDRAFVTLQKLHQMLAFISDYANGAILR